MLIHRGLCTSPSRGGRPHLPQNVRLWLGDSIGHWEGFCAGDIGQALSEALDFGVGSVGSVATTPLAPAQR